MVKTSIRALTRRLGAVLAVVVLSCSFGIDVSGATNEQPQPFGNDRVGDCQYEAVANLILYQFPGSTIRDKQVIQAWHSYGIGGTSLGEPDGLAFLQNHGFAGHRPYGVEPITTEAQILKAANAGGVYVIQIISQTEAHAVDIVESAGTTIVVIDDGGVFRYTWKSFIYWYDSAWIGGHTVHDDYFYAVTW
jgi:hypothetical protein